jgi:sulfite reductase beta subunit-like hemoprotein
MCAQDKYWEVGKAIMTTFRDYGYRYNPRTKCRLMYLINDMGMEVFLFFSKGTFFSSPKSYIVAL